MNTITGIFASGVVRIVLNNENERFGRSGHDSYILQFVAAGGGRLGGLVALYRIFDLWLACVTQARATLRLDYPSNSSAAATFFRIR